MADANEVVIAANGKVYTAPAGTALPATTATALNAAFIDVGYISEDGVQFSDSREISDVEAWQAFYPIRKHVTAKDSSVEFVMRQWNSDNIVLAFGGGEVDVSSTEVGYIPPAPGDAQDYRAMIIDWSDGDKDYRLVIPRGLVTGDAEVSLVRTEASDLPVSFSIIPAGLPTAGAFDSSQPWFLLTNDPNVTT